MDRGFPIEVNFEFYPSCRQDGLFKLVKKSANIVEDFVDRDDFLYFRQTSFQDLSGSDVEILVSFPKMFRWRYETIVAENNGKVWPKCK